jgi:hypothetical protein
MAAISDPVRLPYPAGRGFRGAANAEARPEI